MRSLILTLILTICVSNLKGQDSINYVPVNSLNVEKEYGLLEFDSVYFKLPIIKKSECKFHIRIHLQSQIIDLFDGSSYQSKGTITNIIKKYSNESNDLQEISKEEYAFQQIPIEADKVKQIIGYVLKSNLSKIPTDSLIPDWGRYMHCSNIIVQYCVEGNYTEKRYNCPWSQPDTVKFKEALVSLSNYLSIQLNLDSLYMQFFDQLPKGYAYSKNGYIMQYKRTDEEIEDWKKMEPHWKYMQSVKDSLNTYLSKELTRLISISNFDCNNQFFLELSKKSRLKKIYTNTKVDDVWLVGEYYKCKREIRKAFRKIRVDFISPEKAYFKELMLFEDRIVILQ